MVKITKVSGLEREQKNKTEKKIILKLRMFDEKKKRVHSNNVAGTRCKVERTKRR